jgi:hypothetical protein
MELEAVVFLKVRPLMVEVLAPHHSLVQVLALRLLNKIMVEVEVEVEVELMRILAMEPRVL